MPGVDVVWMCFIARVSSPSNKSLRVVVGKKVRMWVSTRVSARMRVRML